MQEAGRKISSISPSRVGVIGVGNLGGPMAERLLAAGLPTAVIDTNLASGRFDGPSKNRLNLRMGSVIFPLLRDS